MDDFDNEIPDNQLFVSLELEFKAVRVVDRKLIPTKIKINTELFPNEPLADNTQSLMTGFFSKLKYFNEQVLDNSLLISNDNEWALARFLEANGLADTSNNVILLPDNASDARLSEVLQCKFRALANDAITVGFIQVKAADSHGLAFTFVGDSLFCLPDMENWIGERSYFTKPWWERDDASTMDVTPSEDSDLNSPPNFAYSLGFLLEEDQNTPPKVIRAEFKPRVIDGGKTD